MTKVTADDIKNINEIYLLTGTYAETARQTGFSAGTVKKYIIPNYIPEDKLTINKFDINDLPEFDYKIFRGIKWNELLILSDEEKEKIKLLWKEMSV